MDPTRTFRTLFGIPIGFRTAVAWKYAAATAICAPCLFTGLIAKGPANATPRGAANRSTGVDEMLGGGARAKHAARLAAFNIDGKSHSWVEFAAWGRELFVNGQAKTPPTGPSPSKLISEFYQCAHCHNAQREDPALTQQDPEARWAWIATPSKTVAASAKPPFLASGTTMWGVVNRESFYNDAYELYHSLTVDGDREMDPTSLEDAVQVCCTYCSVGRLGEPWEILSLLTYFWDLEVRVADLDLPPDVETAVLATLQDKNAANEQIETTKRFLRRQFLRRAGDVCTVPPMFDGQKQGPYPDKLVFEGDAKIGKALYESACALCHGEGKPNERSGVDLVVDIKRFHTVLSFGTSRDDQPYMPMFTAQRLSRQQAADIQTHLTSLKK